MQTVLKGKGSGSFNKNDKSVKLKMIILISQPKHMLRVLKRTISSADPEGGTGGRDPPWKITSYMGFYRE